MTVNFHTYNFPVNSGDEVGKDCPICLFDVEDSEGIKEHGVVVAHENGGDLHPIHKGCLLSTINKINNNLCPTCRVPMNANSLFSWQERMIVELNQMKPDANNGALLGLISGIFLLVFFKTMSLVKNEMEHTEYIGFGVFARLIIENRTIDTKTAAAVLGSITAVFLGASKNLPTALIVTAAAITGAAMSVTTGILERKIQLCAN